MSGSAKMGKKSNVLVLPQLNWDLRLFLEDVQTNTGDLQNN